MLVFWRTKKLLLPIIVAALLLEEISPEAIVEARPKAKVSGNGWTSLPQARPKTSMRIDSEPSAVFLPQGSQPDFAGSRQFSRNLDWQGFPKNSMMFQPAAQPIPGKLKPQSLETLSQGLGNPGFPLFQIAPLATPAMPIGSGTPITGAQSQPLIPPGGSPAATAVASETDINAGAIFRLPPGMNQQIKTLELRETDLREALWSLVAIVNQYGSVNLMLANNITGQVNILFRDVTIEEAFNVLIKTYSLSFSWEGNILRIYPSSEAPLSNVIFNIKNSNATQVKTVVDRLLTPNRGRCDVDARLNAIMVSDIPSVVETIRALLPQIDVQETSVEITSRPMTEVFYLDYVDASVLNAPIQMVAPQAVIQAYSTSSSQAAAGGAAGGGRSDMMIITDTPNNLLRIREMIEKLDVAPIQITINAHIYEIDLNEEERLGINWQKSIPVPGTAETAFSASIAPEDSTAGGTGVFRFGSLNINQFSALLAMLKTHSFAKVLSNPVITTLNNRQANIVVGQSIPYTTTTVVPGQSGPVTTTNVNFATPRITLTVTPSVTGNDEVFLLLAPDIQSVTGVTVSNAPPTTNSRTAQTQVIVKNNHTIIIGGMIKTDKSESISKVPFFGDLPGIGKLFQKKSQKESRTELIIFITPHIVRSQSNTPQAKGSDKAPPPKLVLQ